MSYYLHDQWLSPLGQKELPDGQVLLSTGHLAQIYIVILRNTLNLQRITLQSMARPA